MWVCPDRAATSLCAHLKRHFLDSLSPESSLKGQTEQIFLHMLKLLLSVQSVWFLKFDDSALAAWRDTTSQLSAFLCHHLTCFEACGCEVFTQRIVNQTWIQSGFCLDLNEVESCRGGGGILRVYRVLITDGGLLWTSTKRPESVKSKSFSVWSPSSLCSHSSALSSVIMFGM